MRTRMFGVLSFMACMCLGVACDESEDGGTQTADDGNADETGDGDGDGDSDGTSGNDNAYCEGLEMDGLLAADCGCVEPGEPCAQGCFFPDDDATTCATVCGSIGETCVENGCSGWTYLSGVPGTCPEAASEYVLLHAVVIRPISG